jgi:hypothetical protein
MAELWALLWRAAPAIVAAVKDLLKAAKAGESEAQILQRAEHAAHVISFEIALRKAREAGRRKVSP